MMFHCGARVGRASFALCVIIFYFSGFVSNGVFSYLESGGLMVCF